MLYICLGKITKKPKGTVEIKKEALSYWEKNFIMKPCNESFRGKYSHELKFENNEIRLATQKEIGVYLDSIKPKPKKERILDVLGLTEEDIVKIKAL